MTIVMIGIDLGKNSCSEAALDEQGSVVLRRRMRPTSIVEFAAKYVPCTVAMEACCGASSTDAANEHCGVRGEVCALHGRDGGVLWCSLSGAPTCRAGTHSQTHAARICASLCEGAEE